MDQQQVVLTQYLRRGENMGCADCDTRTPRWASLSFGNFICIRCAGNPHKYFFGYFSYIYRIAQAARCTYNTS